MTRYATCYICAGDYEVEDMTEDIQGAMYCPRHAVDVCPVHNKYEDDCV